MRKTAVAAVALASVTAFTGASAAPATAPVAEAKATHVLKWRLTETASHNFGNSFVGADTIRSAKTRKIVGYDSTTGRYFPKTQRAVIQVAAAVKGGIIIGQVHGRFTRNDVVFHGRVLRGTGKFNGAEGTIVAKPIAGGQKTFVRIVYTV